MLRLCLLLLFGFVGLMACQRHHSTANDAGYQLVWADEFNYEGLPDPLKWSYLVGNGCPNLCGWGNNEAQFYQANDLRTARVGNGVLTIEAHKTNDVNQPYTSARLRTLRKGDWTYGKFKIRAKLPKGIGVWPAIWMLSSDNVYGGWPASGEIDIMENVGYAPDSIFSSIHTEHFNHLIGTQATRGIQNSSLQSDFHDYGIEWTKEKMDFFMDDQLVLSFKNRNTGSGDWPFDQAFHLLLNVAVGGNWGGKKGIDDTIWPQKMEVDYVRIYQKKSH